MLTLESTNYPIRGRGRRGSGIRGRANGVRSRANGIRGRRTHIDPPPLMDQPVLPPPRRYPYPPHMGLPPMSPLGRMRMPPHYPRLRGRGFNPSMGRGGYPNFPPHPMDIGGLPPHGRYPGGPRMRLPPPPFMHGRGNTRMIRFRGREMNNRSHRGRQKSKQSNVQVESSPGSSELNKPWVTEAIKNEIIKKHKFHQKAKRGKSKDDWELFKEQRNKVTTMLREAKVEYIEAHPEEEINDAPTQSTANAEIMQEGDEPIKLKEGVEPVDETPTVGDNDINENISVEATEQTEA